MAETVYFANLKLFEMDGAGTDRRVSPTGNTVDRFTHFGHAWNGSEGTSWNITTTSARAVRFTGVREIKKIWLKIGSRAGTGTCRVSIQTDGGGGEPSGTIVTGLSAGIIFEDLEQTAWNMWDFGEGATLTESAIYWIVVENLEGVSGSCTLSASTRQSAVDNWLSTCFYQGYNVESVGVWQGFKEYGLFKFIMYGRSSCGLTGLGLYSTAADFTADMLDEWLPSVLNDESTLYRMVLQVEPVDDNWKASKDADNDCLVKPGTGSTTWSGFEEAATPHATNKTLFDNQFGPDSAESVYVAPDIPTGGNQDVEWSGTDTNIPQESTDSPPVQCGDIPATAGDIDGYESGQAWEDYMSVQTDQYDHQTFEIWFKVNSNFAGGDTPEIEYSNVGGGGGGVAMVALRFRVRVDEVPYEVDEYESTAVTDVVTDVDIGVGVEHLSIDETDAVETITVTDVISGIEIDFNIDEYDTITLVEDVPRPDVAYDAAELITTPSYDTAVGAANYRVVVPASDIDFDGEQMRVVLLGDDSVSLVVTSCSLGLRDSSSEDYEVGSFQKITFDGQDGVTIPAGGEAFSDWEDFPCDAAEDYLVHIYIAAAHEYPYESD